MYLYYTAAAMHGLISKTVHHHHICVVPAAVFLCCLFLQFSRSPRTRACTMKMTDENTTELYYCDDSDAKRHYPFI